MAVIGPNGRSQVLLVGALGTSSPRTISAGSVNSKRIAVRTGPPASTTGRPPFITRTGWTHRLVPAGMTVGPAAAMASRLALGLGWLKSVGGDSAGGTKSSPGMISTCGATALRGSSSNLSGRTVPIFTSARCGKATFVAARAEKVTRLAG